ncbi:hypothetical protein [Nocardia bovistercoris]|uniref:Uncharacterized protein n=1 Tax=Nocardia bovistercoris TaxID=2785916 RepID=A0A931IBE6_9NOCA|nr:hypothetical protein [Nocardia bovistercoris]MBH0777360.1 hypothetical protein [Nocardia bovistercoris]
MVISKALGLGQAAIVTFAVAVFPIWILICLLAAATLRRRANTFIRCRPIVSTDAFEFEAHPRFATAMTDSSADDFT